MLASGFSQRFSEGSKDAQLGTFAVGITTNVSASGASKGFELARELGELYRGEQGRTGGGVGWRRRRRCR